MALQRFHRGDSDFITGDFVYHKLRLRRWAVLGDQLKTEAQTFRQHTLKFTNAHPDQSYRLVARNVEHSIQNALG